MKNLRKRIEALLNSPKYTPLNKSEFARALQISSNHRSALRAELISMENKGEIVRGKKGRFSPRAMAGQGKGAHTKGEDRKHDKHKSRRGASEPLLIGVIRFQQSGHAWFYPDANDATNEAAGMDLQKYSRIFISSTKTDDPGSD